MLVNECMTQNVSLAEPNMTLATAAQMMKAGDFGILPVSENDRLIGMITDRDIVIRGIAEGKNPETTTIAEIMSDEVLYCYEDQRVEEVARNMGDNQVRRLPVLNRQKRMVGILSLGDIALPSNDTLTVAETLSMISRPQDLEEFIPTLY